MLSKLRACSITTILFNQYILTESIIKCIKVSIDSKIRFKIFNTNLNLQYQHLDQCISNLVTEFTCVPCCKAWFILSLSSHLMVSIP